MIKLINQELMTILVFYYIKLFFKDDLGLEDQQLSQLITVCNILGDFKAKYLIGVSEEEYVKNCNLVLKAKKI